MDYLRSRPEVDPERITIIGHSQGAQADFTIDLLGTLGISEDSALADPRVAGLVEMVDGVDAIRQGSDDPVAATSAAFWRSWLGLHERGQAAAATIDQPLLVLNGELDWNVDATEAAAWGTLLAEVGADYQAVTLPCITHAMNCVAESDPAAMTPSDIGAEVAPAVMKALVGFLSR